MGRVRAYIDIKGRKYRTLFDTGSRNSYVLPHVAKGFPILSLPVAFKVALGGRTHRLKQCCALAAKVEGNPIDIEAYIISTIGEDGDKKKIEILFGALMMQKWGIRVLPREDRLDLTYYSKEFVEYILFD